MRTGVRAFVLAAAITVPGIFAAAGETIVKNRPVEAGRPSPAPRRFAATRHKELVADLDRMLATLERRDAQIIDARSRGRFAATEPEIRPGLRGGHIPGSLNLPYNELFSPDDDLLRPDADVRGAFQGAGLDLARPVVATCGSGVSAGGPM